jgi:hypothetical protein
MRTGHAPLVPGRYDTIIDVNRNRVYDASADGVDSGSPGFVVITTPPPTPPTDVPTLMPRGIIALVGLLCVVGASCIVPKPLTLYTHHPHMGRRNKVIKLTDKKIRYIIR